MLNAGLGLVFAVLDIAMYIFLLSPAVEKLLFSAPCSSASSVFPESLLSDADLIRGIYAAGASACSSNHSLIILSSITSSKYGV